MEGLDGQYADEYIKVYEDIKQHEILLLYSRDVRLMLLSP